MRAHLISVPILLSSCMSAQTLDLPARSSNALAGSALLPVIANLSVADRERIVFEEVMAGNVPSSLRDFVRVPITRPDGNGWPRTIELEVAPDYVAVGSDNDFFRVPLTPTLGQRIADRLDCTMPTRQMVDDIWNAAPIQLSPVTFNPAVHNIVSPSLFLQHHRAIELQRAGRPLGQLVAGIKKDVVITARLNNLSGRVAIYGWHRPNGSPIQPLYTGHVDFYADYSHGVRLVRNRVLVDGSEMTVASVLADPLLHPLLSDEGAFTSVRYPTPQTAAAETWPLIDGFAATGPALASWTAKFTPPRTLGMAPTSPGGDGTVIRVDDPAGGTDTIRLGHPSTRDQIVQADVYCDYRPQFASIGFERVGIFARDRARGAFDGTQSQQGACYALAWDSHDGRLWCMRVSGGVLTDLAPQPLVLASSGWRRLRIEARGDHLEFFVDAVQVARAFDATHPSGEFGIGHHEFFASNSHVRGTRADNFFADVPGGFRLRLGVETPGALTLDVARAVPGDIYFTPLTFERRAFPSGWFYGLDPTLDELGSALVGGPAFVGIVDAEGRSSATLIGIPAGLDLFAVGLDVFRLLPPVAVSAPVTGTTR